MKICDDDETLAVNADPSHCWEGETWESRFLKVGRYVYAAHIKNFVIRPGFPLRAMISDWPRRAMQFTDLGTGDLNMQRYAELLLQIGYPQRYTRLMGRPTAPLVVRFVPSVPFVHFPFPCAFGSRATTSTRSDGSP